MLSASRTRLIGKMNGAAKIMFALEADRSDIQILDVTVTYIVLIGLTNVASV